MGVHVGYDSDLDLSQLPKPYQGHISLHVYSIQISCTGSDSDELNEGDSGTGRTRDNYQYPLNYACHR